MLPKIAAVAAALLLAACAAPEVKIGKLPALTDAANAGEIVVFREKAFIADEFPFYLNVDQQDVLDLEQGQHARFKLAAGEHRIAVRCYVPYLGEWRETVVNERVTAGQTRYFRVQPKGNCATLDPVTEAQARRPLSNTSARRI